MASLGIDPAKVIKPHSWLNSLPDEILLIIYIFLPVSDVIALLRTSRRFARIAEASSLWRAYCRRDYRYWSSEHAISTDSKSLYRHRREKDRSVTQALEDVVQVAQDRVFKIRAIVDEGYDVKDVVLRHAQVKDDAEDALARRHWCLAIVKQLHRKIAIKDWLTIQDADPNCLERAVINFNYFAPAKLEDDKDTWMAQMDRLAEQYRHDHPADPDTTTRKEARRLAQWYSSKLLAGTNEHELDGDGTGQVTGPADPTLCGYLIIFEVINFCRLASRLGLDARPVSFPCMPLVIIYPPAGSDCNGVPCVAPRKAEPMYVILTAGSGEIAIEKLYEHARCLPLPAGPQAGWLDPAPISKIMIRCGLAIIRSVERYRSGWGSRSPFNRRAGGVRRDDFLDLPWCSACRGDADSAYYGAVWALMVFGSRAEDYLGEQGVDVGAVVADLLKEIQDYTPEDATLMSDRSVRELADSPEYRLVLEYTHRLRSEYAQPTPVRPRNASINHLVKFRVGQLFRHRRYGYQAVIIGWDPACLLEPPFTDPAIDEREWGLKSFYRVIGEDRTHRHVDQENVVLEDREPSDALMSLAGRYFKRWDAERKVFISNVRDEYPDD